MQVQALKKRLARAEAQIQDAVKDTGSSDDSKRKAEELQRLRAQLDESLRNEERLRRQLEEVRLAAGALC